VPPPVQNETFPMGHGRVGIRCRIQQEQLDGVPFGAILLSRRA
jgi:hypothetical protein